MYGGILKTNNVLFTLLVTAMLSFTTYAAEGAAAAVSKTAQTVTSNAAAKAKNATAAKTSTTADRAKSVGNTAQKNAAVKKAKKPVKARKFVVDTKVIAWGREASDAESMANGRALRLVGAQGDKYLIKDAAYVYDSSSSKYICSLRVNFEDQMPETWYLETEMTTGFGKNYERAYFDAMSKAAARVNTSQDTSDWANIKCVIKSSAEMGIIPYEFTFSAVGKEMCCKLYYRYFLPRKK